jgi:hypothetical protein
MGEVEAASSFGSISKPKICQNMQTTREWRVIEVVEEVFGEPDEVLLLLGVDSGGRINTSYVEKLNLSIRNSLARFLRRGMNCSKDLKIHSKDIDLFQAWYNFVKPHKSLRRELKNEKQKWMPRTPAIGRGLTIISGL